MTAHSKIRGFTLAALSVFALSACEATVATPLNAAPATDTAAQNGLVPVDVIALRDTYLSSQPAGKGLRLVSNGGRGYVMYANGRVDGVANASGGRVVAESHITSANGNKVCVAPSGGWTGGCFELWKRPNGDLQMDNIYGNGRTSSVKVKGLKM